MEVNSSAADFSTKVMRFWGNGTVEDNVTMLGPIMAYSEKIPGATTGVTKRIDRRNGGERRTVQKLYNIRIYRRGHNIY